MIFIVRVSDSERLSDFHKIFIIIKVFDSMKTFAIVGCGRLGKVVAEAVLCGFLPEYRLVGAYSRTYEHAEALASKV